MKIWDNDAWCLNSVFNDFNVVHFGPDSSFSRLQFSTIFNQYQDLKIQTWTGFEPWPLRYRCCALPVYLSGQLRAGRYLSSWSWQNVEDRYRFTINYKKLVLSNKLIMVELSPWKIWKTDVSSADLSSERIEELWMLLVFMRVWRSFYNKLQSLVFWKS